MIFSGETGIIRALDQAQVTIAFSINDACDTCGLKVVCAPGKSLDQKLTPISGLKSPDDVIPRESLQDTQTSPPEVVTELSRSTLEGAFNRLGSADGNQFGLTLPNPGDLSIGQSVQVEEMSNLELHLALIQFGLPMLLFLFGLGVGSVLPQSLMPKELMAFLVGLVGLGISFFVAKHLVRRITDIIPDKYLRIRPLSCG